MIVHKVENNLTLSSNWINKTKHKELTNGLSKNMQNKTPLLKEFYQLNIDFVNKDITKKDFLRKILGLSEAIYKSKEMMNEGEVYLIDSYRMFFDLEGCNANALKRNKIIESLDFIM